MYIWPQFLLTNDKKSFKVGRLPMIYLTWKFSGQTRQYRNQSCYVLKFGVATFFSINITSQGRLRTAGTSLIGDPL